MKYRSQHGMHSLSMKGKKPINFVQHKDGHGEFVTEDASVMAHIENSVPFKNGVIERVEGVRQIEKDDKKGMIAKAAEAIRSKFR